VPHPDCLSDCPRCIELNNRQRANRKRLREISNEIHLEVGNAIRWTPILDPHPQQRKDSDRSRRRNVKELDEIALKVTQTPTVSDAAKVWLNNRPDVVRDVVHCCCNGLVEQELKNEGRDESLPSTDEIANLVLKRNFTKDDLKEIRETFHLPRG
jgi:hypothetical protein